MAAPPLLLLLLCLLAAIFNNQFNLSRSALFKFKNQDCGTALFTPSPSPSPSPSLNGYTHFLSLPKSLRPWLRHHSSSSSAYSQPSSIINSISRHGRLPCSSSRIKIAELPCSSSRIKIVEEERMMVKHIGDERIRANHSNSISNPRWLREKMAG
ncbi:uncharacterized protein LOC127262924 [Andrographis paniculata]|uniref:uncharacterized protein LOC127262924 n=1 Tax=Andrographis paniculata TaxID=175694 RepID=UPI0021E993A7|nr:uncharacterized protein LOC127262924 [Andrographis paniculata]